MAEKNNYGYDEILQASPEEIERRRQAVQENRLGAAQKRTSTQQIREMRRKSRGIIERKIENAPKYEAEPIVEEKPIRKTGRKVTLSKKDYLKRLRVVALISAGLTILISKGVTTFVDDWKNERKVIEHSAGFYQEYIAGEAHPTKNHQYYYYDYEDIGKKVMASEDIEETVYMLIRSINTEQANLVMATTPYKGLDIFITSRGYADLKTFKKEMAKKMQLEEDIKAAQEEIEKMQQEHSNDEMAENIERSFK